MKKVMFAAAVAATMFAMGDGVESGVVGYTSYAVPANASFINCGIAFDNIADENGEFKVGQTVFSRAVLDGDAFYLFDYDEYDLTIYTYFEGEGWFATYADGTSDYQNELVFTKGDMFWFVPADGETGLTVAGAVATSGTKTITFDPEQAPFFNIVNPFPVNTTFATLTSFLGDGDALYFFDYDEYDLTIYTYFEGEGWFATYADGTSAYVVDEANTVALEVGEGAILTVGDVRTWTVTLNY